MDQDNTRFHVLYGGLIAVLVLFVVVLLALVAAQMSPAHAQQMPCKPIAEMKALLIERYHEREVGAGMAGQTQIFVLYASEGGKTWTMLAIGTTGLACAVATGSHWTPADRGV